MAAKDITQTHKEFKERDKRLKIKQSFDEQENSKLNEIKDIEDEIKKLESIKKEKSKEYNDISSQKLKKLSKVYNDKELLERITELAEHTTFSNSNIEDIKKMVESGINSDNVNLEIIEKITLAEESINDEIRHTNYIGDILDRFGGTIKLPDGKGGS